MKYHTPKACKICKSCLIEPSYFGLIRNGAFGNFLEASIYLCKSCGCKFLDEEACLDEESYSKGDYRNLLKQNYDVNTYRENHNDFVNCRLELIKLVSLTIFAFSAIGLPLNTFIDRENDDII